MNRRGFLSRLGISAAAAAVLPASQLFARAAPVVTPLVPSTVVLAPMRSAMSTTFGRDYVRQARRVRELVDGAQMHKFSVGRT